MGYIIDEWDSCGYMTVEENGYRYKIYRLQSDDRSWKDDCLLYDSNTCVCLGHYNNIDKALDFINMLLDINCGGIGNDQINCRR